MKQRLLLFTFAVLLHGLTFAQKKPKFNPNEPFLALNTYFNTREDRIKFMENSMCYQCKDKFVYNNLVSKIKEKPDYGLLDKKYVISNGSIITIKMSDNCLFVFSFHNICNERKDVTNPILTDSVHIGYFSYKYGDIETNSVKFLFLTKKRLLVNNNIFTEEVTIANNIKFIIENKSTVTKIIMGSKEIILTQSDQY